MEKNTRTVQFVKYDIERKDSDEYVIEFSTNKSEKITFPITEDTAKKILAYVTDMMHECESTIED